MSDKFPYSFSLDEIQYLNALIENEKIKILPLIDKNRKSYFLSKNESELLRDTLTLQLAEFGFNEDYSLNKTGVIIEELIDKLL
jgi:hypothetical protein